MFLTSRMYTLCQWQLSWVQVKSSVWVCCIEQNNKWPEGKTYICQYSEKLISVTWYSINCQTIYCYIDFMNTVSIRFAKTWKVCRCPIESSGTWLIPGGSTHQWNHKLFISTSQKYQWKRRVCSSWAKASLSKVLKYTPDSGGHGEPRAWYTRRTSVVTTLSSFNREVAPPTDFPKNPAVSL